MIYLTKDTLYPATVSELFSDYYVLCVFLFCFVLFCLCFWSYWEMGEYLGGKCHHHTRLHHDDVIKWKHFLRNCSFVRRIHQSLVDSPHKGQRPPALTFSLICASTNVWAHNQDADVLRRHRGHYDVTVMVVYWIRSKVWIWHLSASQLIHAELRINNILWLE